MKKKAKDLNAQDKLLIEGRGWKIDYVETKLGITHIVIRHPVWSRFPYASPMTIQVDSDRELSTC